MIKLDYIFDKCTIKHFGDHGGCINMTKPQLDDTVLHFNNRIFIYDICRYKLIQNSSMHKDIFYRMFNRL